MENNLIVVKGNILLAAQANNLQKLLQEGENIVITEENINDPIPAFDNLVVVSKKLSALENPHKNPWQEWNAAFKSVNDPVQQLITRIRDKKSVVANTMKERQAKIDAANLKISTIKTTIQNKSIEFSQQIAGATTNEELIRIEKLIGSEKARKNFYEDYITDLIIALEELTPLIKLQKGHIKELMDVSDAKLEAGQFEDDEKYLALEEKEEQLREKISQTQTQVQHTALNSAMKTESVESVSETVLPKARRTTWEYEIKDVKLLAKLYPEFVYIEINHKAIKNWLKEGKENETVHEYENGALKVFQKSTY